QLRPRFPVVAGLVDVRMQIVALMTICSHVGGTCVEWRGLNLADAAPFRQIFRRDVGPILSIVAGDLDEAVISAYPQQTLVKRRLHQRKNGVVVLSTGI